MDNYEAQMAYFRALLSGEPEITQELISDTVRNSGFPLSEEDQTKIIRSLEANFNITQRTGATVSRKEHVPWLARRRPEIGFYYWNRLRKYYINEGVLPGRIINVLDNVTDEILDFSGNPKDPGPWKKRGMVLGHVQSGKTTNYSALICKAADAGYKIIIVLAGITNSLRSQTQERIDETFIGRVSVFQGATPRAMKITYFGDTDVQTRFPAYGTSRDRDFSVNTARTAGVSLASLNEPMIFVTKKNRAILDNLRKWIEQENPGGRIDHPLLLIDDEADNASINTSAQPDRVTAINRAIRDILALFSRSTYIGYTATPFANIFIDPDTEDEMLGHDLFPNDFIKALDPPSNYVGPTRVFEENGDLRNSMIRCVEDFADIIPLRHKKHHTPDFLPPSLEEAIRIFIIARAIRILRGFRVEHSSMMINVSRFNDVQERIEGLVYRYLQELRNSVTVSSGLPGGVRRDNNLAAMKEDFSREFSNCRASWEEVQSMLRDAITPVQIRTVNMRGGQLDYSLNPQEGLHVIAIGGLALSRGLTLEGLLVSYVLRNAGASDTLMQMARWFGYRPSYEDLCRLYLPEVSVDHYDFVNEATEELRSEIKRMQKLNMTPADFGLRVRHSPAVIQITAANKMRTATSMTIALDYSGRHVEGYRLPNDENTFRKNRDMLVKFLDSLGEPEDDARTRTRVRIWRNVPGRDVLELIRNFRFSPCHTDLGEINQGPGPSLFSDYVSDRIAGELGSWDIAFPFVQRVEETSDDPPDFRDFRLRRRKAGQIKDGDYLVTGGKNRLSNPGDERLGYTQEEVDKIEEEVERDGLRKETELNLSRPRPLMIAHLFVAELKNLSEGKLETDGCVASLSFCMPGTRIPPVPQTYAVNAVYRRQLELFMNEEEDDTEYLEEL